MVLELARPRPIWQIMFSTHHTDVGLLYLTFSLLAMFIVGAMAIALRVELFAPGAQLIQDSMTFNRLFTSHGTTMIFLFCFHLHLQLVTILFQSWSDTKTWLIQNLMLLHSG